MKERSTLAPEWQPIETAPKDGTVMILLEHRREYSSSTIDFGCFEFIENSDWDGAAVYGWMSNEGKIEEPTHWMPLPTEPK
jgi:hypothetical protein